MEGRHGFWRRVTKGSSRPSGCNTTDFALTSLMATGTMLGTEFHVAVSIASLPNIQHSFTIVAEASRVSTSIARRQLGYMPADT
jgi:hypothetical protein